MARVVLCSWLVVPVARVATLWFLLALVPLVAARCSFPVVAARPVPVARSRLSPLMVGRLVPVAVLFSAAAMPRATAALCRSALARRLLARLALCQLTSVRAALVLVEPLPWVRAAQRLRLARVAMLLWAQARALMAARLMCAQVRVPALAAM
jgi:hypothetical protein